MAIKYDNFKVDPLRQPGAAYALNKLANGPSDVVKSAHYGKVLNAAMQNEHSRLRAADTAGIRFKNYMNQLAKQEAHNARMNALAERKIGLEKSQDDKALKGAMIGGLLELGNIGLNLSAKREQELIDYENRQVDADLLRMKADEFYENNLTIGSDGKENISDAAFKKYMNYYDKARHLEGRRPQGIKFSWPFGGKG